MAKFDAGRTQVTLTGTFTVDEEELRALEAMVGYGFESFTNVFYEKLGKHYMQDHEDGLRRFFKTISEEVPSLLRQVETARKALTTPPRLSGRS